MSQYENSSDPYFRSEGKIQYFIGITFQHRIFVLISLLVRASGLAEVWTHTHDNLKFAQYGWRCTTNENSYSDQTLVGNWNQQRFDTDRVLRRQKIPNKDAIDTWNTTYREGNGLNISTHFHFRWQNITLVGQGFDDFAYLD